ncbi:TMV resistance protein N [Glycine soja]
MASNTIIQYSSSSSHSIITTYDVFVSFCGEDTRNNFTAFLFDALSQNCINAFKDDADLKKGESIAPELLQAIEGSRLFVVVFSKNYASSTWCLRELAHICNCTIEASPGRVLPIFYDVDPSEVRKQSGYYGIAFEEHEGRFREDIEKMEEVLRWREALTQVANLSGWDIRNNVEELEKCLVLESVSDVRVVGISGMGGIGKTTLARALYEKIADQYDFHCFVDDEAKNLEAIVVKYISWRVLGTTMRVDALSKMRNLKLLMFPIAWTFSGNLNYLSNELGYLYWKRYPFNLLPPCFQPHKLVELNFCGSKIKQLWEGRKPLPNLRLFDVSNCKNLIEVPNFGEAPNLATLNLCGCIRLRQLHSSIGLLRKLTILNLKECRSLTDLPHFVQGLNLEELNLEGCVQLRQIHPSIGHLRQLILLNLKDCKSLVSIPNTILGLNSLECLSLSGCSKLYNIHLSEELRDARYLKKLRMGEAPSCSQSIFSFLKKWLPWPSMAFDKSLEDAHKDSVRCLLPSLPILSSMRELDLSFCNLLKIPDAFGNLHCLEKLCLRGNNFETLPSLKELSKLLHLNLQHCKRLKYLPELPSRTDVPSPSSNKLRWTSVENEEIVLGLNIFNCPELVERDCCTSMCLSWMMQMVQAFSKPKSPWWIPFISSIIPGSKIPRWFDEQHLGMGNVIKIEHASDHFMQHHNNWIGIACSVIFVPHKERTMRHPESFTDESDERPCFYIPLLFRKDLVTDELDHMLLFYYTRESFTFLTSFEHRDKLKVVCASSDPDQYFDVEVKKYGYRRVYKHDLELSNLTTMHRKNLLPRKRKFLAIKENKWFNNQHVGKDSFINIKDTSHIMQHDNNWIGVACKGNGSSKTERKYMEYIHLHFGAVLVTDESDHMLLFYLNRPHFI